MFTKNRRQFSVLPPHLSSSDRHVANLASLSRGRSAERLGKARWYDQLASSELGMNVACPHSDPFVVECLLGSQSTCARPVGSKRIFARRFCVGPALKIIGRFLLLLHLSVQQWGSWRLAFRMEEDVTELLMYGALILALFLAAI